jgi:short-subunit dehydrogenase
MTRSTALVTGASIGIGAEFARLLATRGHDLVLVARDQQRLEALAKELEEAHGASCEVQVADLTDAGQLASVEARCVDPERPIEILVNNAGFGSFGTFHELDIETETREIQLNVLALVRLTHAAARTMVPRGHGGILNVASLAGFQPGPQDATYSATKAFVISFSEAIHEELRATGVHVTVLCPGFTRTEFQQRAGAHTESLPSFAWQTPDQVARVGLDALDRNRALVVPGTLNRVVGTFASVSPHAVTRRVSSIVTRRMQ